MSSPPSSSKLEKGAASLLPGTDASIPTLRVPVNADFFDAAIVNKARWAHQQSCRTPAAGLSSSCREAASPSPGREAARPPRAEACCSSGVLATGSMHRALLAARRSAAAKTPVRHGGQRHASCTSPRARKTAHSPGVRSTNPPASHSHWFAEVVGSRPGSAAPRMSAARNLNTVSGTTTSVYY